MTITVASLCYAFLGASFVTILFLIRLRYFETRADHRVAVPPLSHNDLSHPISVIIPTFNEDAVLPATISRLFESCARCSERQDSTELEEPTVIIVNAGHSGRTRASLTSLIAAHPTLHLLAFPGRPSRGAQQNYGAAQAIALAPETSLLLFLHADTFLPTGWDISIQNTLSSDHPPAMGTFTLSLLGRISPSLRLMLWGAKIRARWGALPYGDQGYFLTRRTFEAVEGFPNVPIMEDLGLLRRISRGLINRKVEVLEDLVLTSPRRWNRKGVLKNTVFNQVLIICWLCGVSHETIYRWYYGHASAEDEPISEG